MGRDKLLGIWLKSWGFPEYTECFQLNNIHSEESFYLLKSNRIIVFQELVLLNFDLRLKRIFCYFGLFLKILSIYDFFICVCQSEYDRKLVDIESDQLQRSKILKWIPSIFAFLMLKRSVAWNWLNEGL